MSSYNRRIVLASRPIGAPTSSDFSLLQTPKPNPGNGEVLLRNIYLSLDPFMRGTMNETTLYGLPTPIGGTMVGITVAQVEASNNPEFEIGEWVVAYGGWQDYILSDGSELIKLGSNPTNPSYALGILGMPGFTAYMGLLDIGKPQAGETVVVAAATGGVGSAVGQIAKIQGARVVGIAGGTEKCELAVNEFGFDICIDHKADDFEERLKKACPQGIDVYFENVGGKVFDAVWPLLNVKARIPLCGTIAHYNDTELPQGPNQLSSVLAYLQTKRITMQGFLIMDDYGHRFTEFAKQMMDWFRQGKLKYREHKVQGLENAPKALMGLLQGENIGKVVVQTNQPLAA